MLDATNDVGIEKMYPIVVRIYDVNFNRIMTNLFDIDTLEGLASSTAEVMFDGVNIKLSENGISWNNFTAIGLDNTNANIGESNSIKSRAKSKNEGIIIVGCPCQVCHNTSGTASLQLSDVYDLDVSDYCTDFFYCFENLVT